MLYMIVEYNNPLELQEHVQELLANGWQLQGGVSISGSGYFYKYAQALVTKE